MACGCAAKTNIVYNKQTLMRPIEEPPHEVRPGESCIYCACKHISVAYAELAQQKGMSLEIGELELARRHTLREYPDVASAVAKALLAACRRRPDELAKEITAAIGVALDYAESQQTGEDGGTESEDASTGTYALETIRRNSTGMNPFIGELHLCAAWRLAAEVGYMIPNRAMIIGDLSLAGQYLVRYDYAIETHVRNLRHRVENRRSADLSSDWSGAVAFADSLVRFHMEEYEEKHLEGLKAYINI